MMGMLDMREVAALEPKPTGSLRLDGEVAVVTGACGRLGPSWVAALREAGARVHVTDLEEVKRGNSPFKGIEVGCMDVTSRASVEQFADWCWSLTPVTIVINNAGVDDRPDGSTDAIALAESIARVNLLGTYHMLEVFGRRMAKQGKGAIVNIASLYGLVAPDLRYYDHRGFQKHPLYGATKAGIISLTQYYAAALGPSGVRVNALAPGGIQRPGDALTGQDPQFQAKYTARIPLGRMATVEDIVGPLLLLAAQGAGFINGQTIAIDGGYLAW